MITRLLVGILTPAMRAIHPSPFRRRSTMRNQVPREPSRRPVGAGPCRESRENAKNPTRSKRRRDPERLRDGRDVEPKLCLSSKKWNSTGAGPQQRHYSNVLAFGAKPSARASPRRFAAGFWIGRPLIIPRNIARFPLYAPHVH